MTTTASITPGTTTTTLRFPLERRVADTTYRSRDELAGLELRSLTAADRELIEAAVHGLSERSKLYRFASPMPRVERRVLDFMCAMDGTRHVAWGIFAGGELVAMGRIVRLVREPAVAEVALTVTDHWQRRGLGPRLLRRLAAEAQRLGIRELSFAVLGDNRPAQKMLARFGVRLSFSSGLGEGRLPVTELLGEAAARQETTSLPLAV